MNKPFGFIAIDKPKGLTSHDCVNKVRKAFNIKRVGHGGTLDPSVTGVLPIALGSATRLFPYLPSDKKYSCLIQLGITTTTDDLDGEPISSHPWPVLERNTLEKHLDEFRGPIKQRPPNISSIHIDGERAYKRTYRGEIFDLPKRTITIHELLLLNWDQGAGQLEINVHCSSGTYIRSIARDIGKNLGCGGCLAKLRRTQAMGFKDTQAITFSKDESYESLTTSNIINPALVLDFLPKIKLTTDQELFYWQTGQKLFIPDTRIQFSYEGQQQKQNHPSTAIVVLDLSNEVIGIGTTSNSFLTSKIVFNALG